MEWKKLKEKNWVKAKDFNSKKMINKYEKEKQNKISRNYGTRKNKKNTSNTDTYSSKELKQIANKVNVTTSGSKKEVAKRILKLRGFLPPQHKQGLTKKIKKSVELSGRSNVIIAGGVAANNALREAIKELESVLNIRVYYPSLKYCGDNAAMIAWATILKHRNNHDLNFKPNPRLAIK